MSSSKRADEDSTYKTARTVLPGTVRTGTALEETIQKMLDRMGASRYSHGDTIQYGPDPLDSFEEDFILPSSSKPETIISVTHSNPKIKGHSNENKLHQGLGELYLLKTWRPDLRCIIFMGGPSEKWLDYVPKVFDLFYDGVVHSWDADIRVSLERALRCELKHRRYWTEEQKLRNGIALETDPTKAPVSTLRRDFYREVVPEYLGVSSPKAIQNSPLRIMAQKAMRGGGEFWNYLQEAKMIDIGSERSFFNPVETVTEMILAKNKLDYTMSEAVKRTLLAELGYGKTKRSEDFSLFSRRFNQPVYIQCKASGGGETQHGKQIPDKAREQIARSVIYRTEFKDGELISGKKNFKWIYILDGNWRTPAGHPLKYTRLLQIAGCDYMMGANDLVNERYEPKDDSYLEKVLKGDLDCRTSVRPSLLDY